MGSLNTESGDGNKGRGVLNLVRDSATSQLSSQKERATEGLGSLARAVRQSTQSLRDNQQDTVAQYVEQAADRIEEFSSRLRERDLNDLLRDADQFARRQPAVFIGAAFVVGVLAARFLKSSRTGVERTQFSGQSGLSHAGSGASESWRGNSMRHAPLPTEAQ
jgi:ElaB/YqjD/DUF883 family membrane-anchored ribosome-binding protein